MDDQEFEPKISLPERIFIGLIFVIIDVLEIIIVFVGIDDFWILDTVAGTIFFYLAWKGIPPVRQLIAWLAELVPYLGSLPLLTFGWIMTIWADDHPESVAAQALTTAAAVRGGPRGGAVARGATGATRAGAAMGRGAQAAASTQAQTAALGSEREAFRAASSGTRARTEVGRRMVPTEEGWRAEPVYGEREERTARLPSQQEIGRRMVPTEEGWRAEPVYGDKKRGLSPERLGQEYLLTPFEKLQKQLFEQTTQGKKGANETEEQSPAPRPINQNTTGVPKNKK